MLLCVEHAGKQIRVVLVSDDAVVADFERQARDDEDTFVIGCEPHSISVLLAVREAEADAVVLPASDAKQPGLVSHLLGEFPDLTVITMFPNGEAAVAQRCPVTRIVSSSTRESLLEQIRTHVLSPCSQSARDDFLSTH